MTRKRLLLLSNSTMAGGAYLDYPKYDIQGVPGSRTRDRLIPALCRRD